MKSRVVKGPDLKDCACPLCGEGRVIELDHPQAIMWRCSLPNCGWGISHVKGTLPAWVREWTKPFGYEKLDPDVSRLVLP